MRIARWLDSADPRQGPSAVLASATAMLVGSALLSAVGVPHAWMGGLLTALVAGLTAVGFGAVQQRILTLPRAKMGVFIAIAANLNALRFVVSVAQTAVVAVLFGILCGVVASMVVTAVVRAVRPERARSGSLLAAVRRTRVWLVSLAIAAVAAFCIGMLARRRAIAALELVALAGAMLAIGLVDRRRSRALSGVAGAAERREAEPQTDEWDLGIGDERWWCWVAPSGPYRANERPRLVIRGALTETMALLRRTVRVDALACVATLVAATGVGVYGTRSAVGDEHLLVADGAGFAGSVCEIAINAKSVDQIGTCEAEPSIHMPSLNVSARNYAAGFPGVQGRLEWYAVEFEGTFRVATAGTHRFRLRSDDGSVLWIDGQRVVNNDEPHPPTDVYGSLDLGRGEHSIRVKYFQGPRDAIALELFVTAPLSRWTQLLTLGW